MIDTHTHTYAHMLGPSPAPSRNAAVAHRRYEMNMASAPHALLASYATKDVHTMFQKLFSRKGIYCNGLSASRSLDSVAGVV